MPKIFQKIWTKMGSVHARKWKKTKKKTKNKQTNKQRNPIFTDRVRKWFADFITCQ